jgi:DNA-binding response OmpR family regulator
MRPVRERRTALVLEDEPIIGFALEDMLLAIGFQQVELTTTLEAACLALDSAAFDVAILDVNIHGQRSYPVAALLLGTGTRSIRRSFARCQL